MGEGAQLSIIVPIYNAENFLRKCLDSILAQTMSNFELICVNDGSTDKSFKILDAYEKKDKRVRVVTKPNGGLVSARKAGVSAATGKYIGFVDADDWIEPEMYERLYKLAVENNADLVSSDYIQDGNYTSVSRDAVEAGVYTNEKMQDLLNMAILHLKKKDKGLSGSLCTKLFRSDILKRVIVNIPENITMSEDKVTMISYLLECNSAVIIHEAYYHYIMHNQSMTHSEDSQYLISLNQVFQYLKSLYSHANFSEDMRTQVELYVIQLLIKGINTRLGFTNRNLMWIDPYWMDDLKEKSKIAIYGAGELGAKYYQQIKAAKKFEFVGCIDFGYQTMKGCPFEVWAPERLLERAYDVLIITIKNPISANEVKEKLISCGIKEEKILWFRQDEIFWRFAEADGLLD